MLFSEFPLVQENCYTLPMQGKIASLILAGGNSTRMGTDKAKLILGGRCILEGILQAARQVSGSIVIMRKPGQDLPKMTVPLDQVHVAHDRLEGEGPLQGIADALVHLPEQAERIFVLTCDLPYLSVQWLQTLEVSLTDEWDAVCTLSDGIANPLLAIYRRPVLLRAPELLQAGQRRPIALWKGWRIQRLPVSSESQLVVHDMNTPDDYARACQYFQESYD